MIMNEIQAAVEAILFAAGEPLEVERIAQALEQDIEIVESVLIALKKNLDDTNSGICLVKMDDLYQLRKPPR